MHYSTKPKCVVAWCFQDEEGEVPDFVSEAMSKDRLIPHPMFPETRLQCTCGDQDTPHNKIVDKGDWIIQDADGNLDVMKPDDFVDTYEPVDESAA